MDKHFTHKGIKYYYWTNHEKSKWFGVPNEFGDLKECKFPVNASSKMRKKYLKNNYFREMIGHMIRLDKIADIAINTNNVYLANKAYKGISESGQLFVRDELKELATIDSGMLYDTSDVMNVCNEICKGVN